MYLLHVHVFSLKTASSVSQVTVLGRKKERKKLSVCHRDHRHVDWLTFTPLANLEPPVLAAYWSLE